METISCREPIEASKQYKEAYLLGLENVIQQRERTADAVRYQNCKDILCNQAVYRQSLRAFSVGL